MGKNEECAKVLREALAIDPKSELAQRAFAIVNEK
jgi:Tfp pilus assembly protein PilF